MSDLDDDVTRFTMPHRHRHLTILEAIVKGADGRPTLRGWRLWCMNCDIQGSHVFVGDKAPALEVADELRSEAQPQCPHRHRVRETVYGRDIP